MHSNLLIVSLIVDNFSTTFAAVTSDGKVVVYDIHFDRYQPVCAQSVVSRKMSRLNHISFNPSHPVIIVGDSRGEVTSLKLSPNLRRQSKEVKAATINRDFKKAAMLEVKKLDDLLSQVRGYDVDCGI